MNRRRVVRQLEHAAKSPLPDLCAMGNSCTLPKAVTIVPQGARESIRRKPTDGNRPPA